MINIMNNVLTEKEEQDEEGDADLFLLRPSGVQCGILAHNKSPLIISNVEFS